MDIAAIIASIMAMVSSLLGGVGLPAQSSVPAPIVHDWDDDWDDWDDDWDDDDWDDDWDD